MDKLIKFLEILFSLVIPQYMNKLMRKTTALERVMNIRPMRREQVASAFLCPLE